MWYDEMDENYQGLSDLDRALYLLYIIKSKDYVVPDFVAADIKALLDKYDDNIHKGGF